MFEKQYLAAVRRVEEQLQQKAQENIAIDLTNLVAVFSRRENGPCLAVFNTEETVALPDFFEFLSLDQLLESKRDLSTEYDGMVITFEALDLVRYNIVTRGPRFYPIEQLYRRLNQEGKLPQTQLNLARTLFSTLLANGELGEKAPEYSTATWLKKVALLFRLSLPALLEHCQVGGLLAIVPDENFKRYLDQQQCSLVYVATPVGNIVPDGSNVLDVEHFTDKHISSELQLCAAFEEVKLFNQEINPRRAGFVDLRKELRRGSYSTDIRNTLRQLALLCEQRSRTDSRFVQPAHSLVIEYAVVDQELDNMIGIEFSPDLTVLASSSPECSYYLTLPESQSARKDMASLDDLLTRKTRAKPGNYVASFRSVRELFPTREDTLYSLSDALLRLDQPQVLARSAYLISRFLDKRVDVPIDAEKIIDEAAVSCYVYSLAEPYYYYWPRGNHRHQLLQSYENFHEELDVLTSKVDDNKRKSYYRALKIWWDYREHDVNQRKKLLEEAVKELESLKGSEDTQYYPSAPQLYELFSALLRMFSSTWQPTDIRERLLKAGYDHISRDGVIPLWDILDLSLDPKQPSLLFFENLRQFLNLSEESYTIRIKEHDPDVKTEKLIKIGARLGEQIGLNFNNYMRQYSELHTGLHIGGEDEQGYRTMGEINKKETVFGEGLEDPHLLPIHERLWMRSLYYWAIDAHATIIHNLKRKLGHGKIAPVEVTQYVSTKVEIFSTSEIEEMLKKGREVEIILSSSKDYEIQSRVVRKKFGIELPVRFTVVFHKTGSVALLFKYIIDKREYYPDEAWVHVSRLETQVRKVQNPYQYGDVILSPENYYGRREELMQILDELCEMAGGRQRQNFRLHGIRRSGKTSLLHTIRKAVEEPETRRYFHIPNEMDSALEKWHPVFYDLQGLPRDPDNREHLDSTVFFRSLAQKICEALHWTKKATSSILARINADIVISQNIVDAVKRQLEQVLRKLPPNERILVLLDEVDSIAPERDERFFGQLRSIILSPELQRITWLLTSVRVLQAALEEVESPLHNIFASITLKNLDPAEAHRLIREPAHKSNIYFESEATERILQQTGCQPFFLQVVCHMIVDQLNKEQTAYVSKPLTDVVIEQLLKPGTVIYEQCGFLWAWAKERSRKIILVLLAQHEHGVLKGDLVEAFRGVLSTDEDDTDTLFDFADAWNELFANDLVSQDQNDFCRLTIPIFQRWLKQREMNLRDPR
jgi:AAA ATPase domain